jgi:hypothetical protein
MAKTSPHLLADQQWVEFHCLEVKEFSVSFDPEAKEPDWSFTFMNL